MTVKKLNDKQKLEILKSAYGEIANLLSDDNYADPFKHRDVPFFTESLCDAADDFFFKCIKKIAKELEDKAK